MSTLEHLFMQIFERKDWIEGQLRQQIESYGQSLAYNLIADGVRPPPWLWTAGSDAIARPETKELNREQLISGILLPFSRTTTPLTNHGNLFTLPALKGDHVSDFRPNSFLTEMYEMKKYFNAEQRLKAVPNSDPNDSTRDPDVMVESEVEACAEFDPFSRIQRSRSRQRDIETRPNKKAKRTNHLGEGSTMDEYTGRMTRSKVALGKSDCVKRSSNSLLLHDENGDRVTRSRFTGQKLDCPEKSLKPARSIDWVEDAAHNATKTENDCRPTLSVNVDNCALPNMDGTTQFRRATGTLAKELFSDTARPVHSSLKMTHAVPTQLSETLSLIESKKLLSDRTGECSLNEKSVTAFEKENLSPTSCSKNFQKPALSPIKATSTLISSINVQKDLSMKSLLGRPLNYTMEEQCTGKLMKKLSTVACMPPQTNSLVEPKNHSIRELKSNKKSAAALEKDPEGSYFDIGSTNLETVQSMKEELFCRDAITEHVFPENGQLLVNDVFLTAKVTSKEEVKVSGGVQGEDRLELLKAMESKCYSHHTSSNNKRSSGSPVECITGKKSTGKLIKETTDSPVQVVNNCQNDGSALFFSGKNEVLLEAEEADSASMEVKKKIAAQLKMTPDSTETYDAVLEFQHLLRNSATDDNISVSCCSKGSVLPPSKYGVCLADQGTVVDPGIKDVEKFIVGKTPNTAEVCNSLPKANYFLRSSTSMDRNISSRKLNDPILPNSEAKYVLLKTDVSETYVGSKDVAEKNGVGHQITTDTIETRKTPPKAQYSLRSLSCQDKSVVSSGTIGHHGASGSKQPIGNTACACEISWPKRNKIRGRSNNVFATSPRLRLKPFLHILGSSDRRCKTTSENASGAVLEFQSFPLLSEMETDISNAASRNSLEMLHQSKKCSLIEGGPYLKGKDQIVVTPLPTEHTEEKHYPNLVLGSSRTYEKDEVKATELNILKLKTKCNSNDGHDFLLAENTLECEIPKFSTYYEDFIKEREMCNGEKGSPTNYTFGSSHYQDDIVGCDETMPEFEGFSIGIPSTTDDGIVINDSDLPRLTEERLSMLAQLCKSRSVLTPGARPSTKYKIHKVPDIYQSLPSGLLEHMTLSSSFQFSDVDMGQLRASENGWLNCLRCNLGSDFDGSFSERSNSHSMPSSSAKSEWEAKKPPLTPPVEKLGHRMVSGRSFVSSEKVGSNAELTCFRIDEDSSSTGGYGHLDELDTCEEMAGSRGIKFATSRKALVDITASYNGSPNLVSELEKFLQRESLESVNTESSFGTHMGLGNGYPSNRKAKIEAKSHALSIGGKRVLKAADSLHNRSSKPEISVKANERNKSEVRLVNGCKPNNIVSNLSSFIPLVRQKQQEAAPVKGKKDIKVKALEAAEAAKRLEEKKQNEREMRKAAAKLERERLEQENARRLELKQKQKEEEKRKKEADIAARKRQREEEERKEKGRKRRCIEEARKHQRMQEERVRPEKAEKELRQKAVDGKQTRKKDVGEEAKEKLKQEKVVPGCQKAAEAEPCATKVSVDSRDHDNSLEANDASKNFSDTEKVVSNSGGLQDANQDGKSIVEESQGHQPYEMSPYIDSDDEDGDEESRRRRKYIPSWARKECINQTILSKKDLDPLEIFSRKRSFNLNEVLLPRIRRRPL